MRSIHGSACLAEEVVNERSHGQKRFSGSSHDLIFRCGLKVECVQRSREIPPVQSAASLRGMKMPGAETLRKAEPGCFLEEKGSTQVGAFGDVKPAQGPRQVCKVKRFDRGRRIGVRSSAEVREILFYQTETVSTAEGGEALISSQAAIDWLQRGVETVLQLQELAVAGNVGERIMPHDRLIQMIVRWACCLLEASRARA